MRSLIVIFLTQSLIVDVVMMMMMMMNCNHVCVEQQYNECVPPHHDMPVMHTILIVVLIQIIAHACDWNCALSIGTGGW